MPASLQLHLIERPDYSIKLYIPNPREVQDNYSLQKKKDEQTPFPHWTKLWPSAQALSDFIYQHPELVQHKNVLELAAGLGLPSFVAARYAKAVCCSDYVEEGVAVITRSAQHLRLSNVTCRVLDWNFLPRDIIADVLLLSDINYDPDQFDRLYKVLQQFLRHGTLILLATPQRLMAKPFIERLMPLCRQQYEMAIDNAGQRTMVSLLVV